MCVKGGGGGGVVLPRPAAVCTLRHLLHPQAHPVPHSANDFHTPTVPSRLPQRSLSGKGWVLGACLPHPTDEGGGKGPQLLWPRCTRAGGGGCGEATTGGFLSQPPPPAPALSCRCPPPSQPGAEQLHPAPRPASLPAVSGVGLGSWETAARWRGGAHSGAPCNSRKQSPCPGRGAGGRGGRGLGRSLLRSSPSASGRADPDQSPPGAAAGGEAAESGLRAPLFQPSARALASLLGSSTPCSHPPTHSAPTAVTVPFPQAPSCSPL